MNYSELVKDNKSEENCINLDYELFKHSLKAITLARSYKSTNLIPRDIEIHYVIDFLNDEKFLIQNKLLYKDNEYESKFAWFLRCAPEQVHFPLWKDELVDWFDQYQIGKIEIDANHFIRLFVDEDNLIKLQSYWEETTRKRDEALKIQSEKQKKLREDKLRKRHNQ
jgi:hypothetical protein